MSAGLCFKAQARRVSDARLSRLVELVRVYRQSLQEVLIAVYERVLGRTYGLQAYPEHGTALSSRSARAFRVTHMIMSRPAGGPGLLPPGSGSGCPRALLVPPYDPSLFFRVIPHTLSSPSPSS